MPAKYFHKPTTNSRLRFTIFFFIRDQHKSKHINPGWSSSFKNFLRFEPHTRRRPDYKKRNYIPLYCPLLDLFCIVNPPPGPLTIYFK